MALSDAKQATDYSITVVQVGKIKVSCWSKGLQEKIR